MPIPEGYCCSAERSGIRRRRERAASGTAALGRHRGALYMFRGDVSLNTLGIAQGQTVSGDCSVPAGFLWHQGNPMSWVFQAGGQLRLQQRNG